MHASAPAYPLREQKGLWFQVDSVIFSVSRFVVVVVEVTQLQGGAAACASSCSLRGHDYFSSWFWCCSEWWGLLLI